MKKRTDHMLLILVFSFLLSACENDQARIDALLKDKVMVEEATNVESYLSQNGLIKAKLTSPLMLRVIDSVYTEFPNTLHCDFYNDSSRIETWLDCKYGKYFESQNKVYLRDSVVVISASGDTLRTPDLWWDQSRAIFYTDKPARYTTGTRNILGLRGMEASQDLKRVTFNEGEGMIKVSENGFPK